MGYTGIISYVPGASYYLLLFIIISYYRLARLSIPRLLKDFLVSWPWHSDLQVLFVPICQARSSYYLLVDQVLFVPNFSYYLFLTLVIICS
jgi:hypothetical protein